MIFLQATDLDMDALKRLLVFAVLFLAGNILAGVILLALAVGYGFSPEEITSAMTTPGEMIPRSLLYVLMLVNAFIIFILPAITFGLIYSGPGKIWKHLDLARRPSWRQLALAFVFTISAYPLVQLSYEINALAPLPEWMQALESEAAMLISQLLEMGSFGAFLLTLVLIAVLPGIGEELVFRGIVQKQVGLWLRSGVAAIWIAAFLFSMVHMQFEGFLPRLILGAILGYLYLWTGNLWIPIFIHFLNNAIPTIIMYATGADITGVEGESAMTSILLLVAIFLPSLIWSAVQLRKNPRSDAQDELP